MESTNSILKKKSVDLTQENKHITWDEQSLRIDALQRGKCQKIDEPKTPYHQYKTEGQEGEQEGEDKAIKQYLDEAHLNAERNSGKGKLDSGQLNAQLHQEMEKAGFSLGASQPSQDPQQIRKKQQFQKKRKQHYNEFVHIKQQQEKQQSSGSEAES